MISDSRLLQGVENFYEREQFGVVSLGFEGEKKLNISRLINASLQCKMTAFLQKSVTVVFVDFYDLISLPWDVSVVCGT